MRTHSICLATVLVLISPFASAQWVQTNGLNDRQVLHYPLMGTNVFQETPRELMGLSLQQRIQVGFISRLDSLRASRIPFPDETFIPNGTQGILKPLRRMSSPQSQFYVIDTAIVRGTQDTTRHLYSFNASAKRTSDLTQRLMGEFWVDTLRRTNTYDVSSNMLSDLYENWVNGQWLKSGTAYTYTYDANGHMLSSLSESWSNGQWVNISRYTHAYDASGNKLSELYEEWSNGQWMNRSRGTYTYHAIGNMLSDLWEEWSNGQWVNGTRYTYTCDANGNMLSQLVEEWSIGQWVNAGRSTSTYDANGNVLSQLGEYWENGQWVNNWCYTRTYDANGNMLTYLGDHLENGQWVNNWRYTRTHDASGNILSDLQEYWSANGDRYTYAYDASGNKLSELREQWSNGQWVNHERLTCTYDANRNIASLGHYDWLNSSWVPTDYPRTIGRNSWEVTDSAGNEYSLGFGYNFNLIRKLIVAGVASQIGNVPAIYSLSQNFPNPFNPSTTIKFELPKASHVSLSVYDMLGRQVSLLVNERRDAGVHEVKFDGSNLASGMYFYRLTAGDFVQSKKLVVLK